MSMCSERYAEDTPLGFWKYQLPPTSSEASKQVCGTPKSASDLHAVRPLTPAPMMPTLGSSPTRESYGAPGPRVTPSRRVYAAVMDGTRARELLAAERARLEH